MEEAGKPGTEQLLKFVDTAICSADFLPPGCTGEDAVIEYLRAKGVRQLAITRGANPIRFAARLIRRLHRCSASRGRRYIRRRRHLPRRILLLHLDWLQTSWKHCAKLQESPRSHADSVERANGCEARRSIALCCHCISSQEVALTSYTEQRFTSKRIVVVSCPTSHCDERSAGIPKHFRRDREWPTAAR